MNLKLKSTFVIITLLFITNALNAQDNLFSKLKDNKDISTTIISKALLSLVGNVDVGVNIDTKDIIKKISKIEIYNSESKDAIKEMNQGISSLSKDSNYELLMETKDKNEEDVSFLIKKESNKTINNLIMAINEKDEYTIIRLIGSFTQEDIQAFMKSSENFK